MKLSLEKKLIPVLPEQEDRSAQDECSERRHQAEPGLRGRGWLRGWRRSGPDAVSVPGTSTLPPATTVTSAESSWYPFIWNMTVWLPAGIFVRTIGVTPLYPLSRYTPAPGGME